MLAEKFVLILESLIRTQGQTHSDGSPRVVSTSPHIPIQLPTQSGKQICARCAHAQRYPGDF
jgi:hypothetical protein